MKKVAFPILSRADLLTAQLAEVSVDGLAQRLRDLLPDTTPRESADPKDGVRYRLTAGQFVGVDVAFVGVERDGGRLLLHVPGLAGAFPLPEADVKRHRHWFRAPARRQRPGSGSSAADDEADSDADAAGLMVCAAALERTGRDFSCFLELFARRARRCETWEAGAVALMHSGAAVNAGALQLDFPYHCGGEHAAKEYLDRRPEACALFPLRAAAPAAAGGGAAHGDKFLLRYGVAACVGVSSSAAELECPCLVWHTSGEPAARPEPLMHAARALRVGTIALDYNGPRGDSSLLRPEDMRRYMAVGAAKSAGDGDTNIDTTHWLCEGLFGVSPGAAAHHGGSPAPTHEVLGVAYNAEFQELDLIGRHTVSGEAEILDLI